MVYWKGILAIRKGTMEKCCSCEKEIDRKTAVSYVNNRTGTEKYACSIKCLVAKLDCIINDAGDILKALALIDLKK